jgi:crotonobetainyl-CoA:carnitine CoA-transferase CaiB-like acyl-CoA transferase
MYDDGMNSGPLSGVHVLEVGMNIAGPYAASLLADFGAAAIKLEPPQGDTARATPPVRAGIGALFASVNHEKRYLALNLRHPESAAVRDRLIEWADVVIQNLRPGRAADMGLSAEDCHRIKPSIVHCSVEAFHPSDRGRAGYDLLVQAESGLMALSGPPEGEACRVPAAAIDHATGLWIAFAVAAELRGARESVALRFSMLDVALGLLNERVSSYLVSGQEPGRMGSATSTTTPHRAYPTADDEIVIGAANDRLFARLASALGPPLEGDERFVTMQGRLDHRAELDRIIVSILAGASAASWRERLDAAGVPVAKVRGLGEAVERHRATSPTGFFRPDHVDTAEGQDLVPVLAPPVQVSDHEWSQTRGVGLVGRDSREILLELGLAAHEIEDLVANAVVAAPSLDPVAEAAR